MDLKTIQNTHQVIRFHRYGGSEVLQLENIPIPEITDDEVLIKIKATGVNPLDWKLREGLWSVPLPFIPGIEAAGLVLKTGRNVTTHSIGQAVYGAIDHGYAQYAIVRPKQVFLKPHHLSFEQAAAMGGGKTAWGALFEVGQLKKGQRILIHGTSGGVGVFALQLAHLAGAHVIATTSGKNMAAVHALGADEVIDYQKEAFEQVVGQVDVVLDGVGGELLEKSYSVVKPGGVLLSIVQQPSPEKAEQYGIKAMWGGTKTLTAMAEVDRLLQSGKIKPVLSKTFVSLRQAAEAQDYSQKGQKQMGKIVITVD